MIVWTERKLKSLHEAMLKGVTAKQYARQRGLSKNAVIAIARRTFGGWGPSHRERLKPAIPVGRPSEYSRREGARIVITAKGRGYLSVAWSDSSIELSEICKIIGVSRKRIYREVKALELGLKAFIRPARGSVGKPKPRPKRENLWPDDMRFTDHPKTVTNSRTGARNVAR